MDARSNVLTQSTTHTPAGMRHLTCSPSVLNGQTLNHSHWRMVLQALAFKARQQKWITIINPPRSLNAEQLSHWGINTTQVRIIHRRSGFDDEALIDAALAAETSCAIIAFTPTSTRLACYEQNKQWVARVDPVLTQRH
ncbi:hypothetical protein [Salinivibrio socompensis]|uniref:hypothetical protein n=1 Tax=Salinivibrio socompensis TaxID=1510206 RepID=UPI000FE14328|nr:hypothetical protein [Salinivibrio socompensis]